MALVIQHIQRIRLIILSSVACPVVPYFSTLSYKPQEFRKKLIKRKMFVLIFSTNTAETFLVVSKIQFNIIINVRRFPCKVPATLVKF